MSANGDSRNQGSGSRRLLDGQNNAVAAAADDDEGNNAKDEDTNSQSPVKKIRYILSDGDDIECLELGSHPLFTQFDVLVHFQDGTEGWKEISRWLKYEETVEVGDRWSKPHVPTTTMHGLQALRQRLVDGKCLTALGRSTSLDGKQQSIADVLADVAADGYGLSDDVSQRIRDVILEPHKHKHRKATKSAGDERRRPNGASKVAEPNKTESKRMFLRRRSGQAKDIALAFYKYPPGTNPTNLAPYKPNKHLMKKLPKNCEAANILVGQVDFLSEELMVFCRLETPSVMADLTEVALPTRFVLLLLGPKDSTVVNAIWEYSEIARAMASLLNDKVFCEVAYKAKTTQDLIDGIDEFIDELTVLPPSIWDPSTRIEPPKHTLSTDGVLRRLDDSTRGPSGPVTVVQEEGAGDDESLLRTGRIFGGLVNDIKHRYSTYLSDITDGLSLQCVASTIFLFFACITPIVTFGGLMGEKTDGYMGTMEMLMAGAVCGVLYALTAGQPLTIVGATGPLLVFESILYHLCHENGLDFMSFRFWIGFWVMMVLLFIVAFDLSALVRYITRFTEESFAVLISVIFIYEAFAKVAEIWSESKVHTGVVREDRSRPWLYHCHCIPDSASSATPAAESANSNNNDSQSHWLTEYNEDCITYRDRLIVRDGCILETECKERGWNLTGAACYVPHITHSVPDVFFMSIILFLGTFTLAMAFRTFRTSRFFPTVVRTTVADFAVFLSVTSWTGIDYLLGLSTPKLNVPAEFKPTRPDRGWLINPMDITYWWMIPLGIIPALLATILIFLDQQITSVIVNRKEHKLKKGHGYHLDLFALAFLIFLCSLMGLPWFVAATVRAITHVRSLMTESEVKIPGERPQIVGVREQRVTGVCIHVLIGLSTLLTSVLRLIPMPVLYGVFLYMGITSLGGVQFIQRIGILLMPNKYQPDYIYLRHVKTIRVHLFTVAQMVCMALMWAVKSIKITSIGFPLMLVALMTVRKLMDFVFTQSDLYWLDHLLPDETRRAKEDQHKSQGKGRAMCSVMDGSRKAKEQEAVGKYRLDDKKSAVV
jgi:anion exchange protein